jgi:bacillithiol biosynthesis cysteine-adding enzyme BshC
MTASMESHCIPFREIPHTSKLFSSFIDNFDSVTAYYAHPPTVQGIAAAAREVRLDPAVRKAVVEILREQNRSFAPGKQLSPEVSRSLDRLAAGAAAMVSGQQVGLFSGPAYTFYKAVSAARAAADTGVDAVPIFWLATEDHDLAEVNHISWVTRNGLARYELPAAVADSGRHVGHVLLGEAIQSLVNTAAQTLEGPFAEEIAGALRESYKSGETYGSAFGKLMARFLAPLGIILIDPLDARLHRLCAPVYRRALEESSALTDALLDRDKQLEARGFHAQVKVTREATLLFFTIDGRREPLRVRNGKFAAGSAEFSLEQLLAALEKTPEAFTPSALFRPAIQDSLLPTAAYFGGPAEVAYFAQSQVIYQRLLGRMPAILSRASFTLVEEPIARFLAHYSLDFRDLLHGTQHVRAAMERKSIPPSLAERFEVSEKNLQAMLKEYEEPLRLLDATLLETLEGAERKILHQFAQLRAKVGRALDFRTGVLDRKEHILFDSLYPEGGLQERSLSLLPFLAAHGTELLGDLTRFSTVPGIGSDNGAPSPCDSQHHVLYL